MAELLDAVSLNLIFISGWSPDVPTKALVAQMESNRFVSGSAGTQAPPRAPDLRSSYMGITARFQRAEVVSSTTGRSNL